MTKLQNNFFKMMSKNIKNILRAIPTMMRQFAIEAQMLNPALLNFVALQVMLTIAISALTPLISLTPPEGAVLSLIPFGHNINSGS